MNLPKYLYLQSLYAKSVRFSSSEVSQNMRIVTENSKCNVRNAMLKVITNGALGMSKSVILRVYGYSYLFNCGEALDRNYSGNVDGVFVTHLNWNSIGGIPSLCHKLTQRNLVELPMYGPDGLDVFIYACERFLPTNDLKLNIKDCTKPIDLSCVKVTPVIFKNRKYTHFKANRINKSWLSRTMPPYHRLGTILTKPPKNKVSLDASIAYICEAKTRRGWLLSECVKRGVKPGPNVQKLWDGEDVILENGTLVKSSDVIRGEKHSDVIVIDCPSPGFLDDLLEKREFDDYLKSSEDFPNRIVVHFTPYSVMHDPRYIKWMERFPDTTHHLVINESNEWNSTEKVASKHQICKLISPRFFPKLCTSAEAHAPTQNLIKIEEGIDINETLSTTVSYSVEEVTTESWLQKWKDLPQNLQLVQAWSGTIVDLMNQQRFRASEPFSNSNLHDLMKDMPISLNSEEIVCNNVPELSPKNPRITFLGTCSQGSSTHRNASGILVEYGPDKSLLLDCGDGILHQMSTLYDQVHLQDLLASLQCVYISHPHADHQAGLIGVLLAIKNARKEAKKKTENLILMAPAPLLDWLEIYHLKFEPILDNVIFIAVSDVISTEDHLKTKIFKLLSERLDLKLVRMSKAVHCPYSYCLTFQHKTGWKISYSGDTMLSPHFIKIGQNSDLLIHEATYATGLDHLAKNHKHSTTDVALEVGRRMHAKYTILTHFSKRYPVIPSLKDVENTTNVGIAFDYLQVFLSDLHLLPKLNETYKVIFEDYETENEEQFRRHQLKKKT